MDRLTYRTEDGWVGVNILEDKTISPTSVAIHKLAEFEDLLEEYNFEDIKTFKMAIKLMQSMNSVGVKYCAENQKLKDRWQKLKESILEFKNRDDTTEDDTAGLWFVIEKMQELEKDDE